MKKKKKTMVLQHNGGLGVGDGVDDVAEPHVTPRAREEERRKEMVTVTVTLMTMITMRNDDDEEGEGEGDVDDDVFHLPFGIVTSAQDVQKGKDWLRIMMYRM